MNPLLKIRPLRKPRANQISTSIYFYSKKLGRQVWCNSNLEWDVAINIEIDPSVIDYCEQAIELEWSKSTWIPDFVVLIREKNEYIIQIIEVKYLRDLIENKHQFEEKYSDTKKWLKNNEKKIIKHLTDKPIKKIEFLVVTDQIINQSFRIQNFRKIIQASIEPSLYIKIKQQVDMMLVKKPKLILKDLIETLELKFHSDNITSDEIWTSILLMIRNFDLFINFETLLTIKSSVFSPKVYKNGFESVKTWFKKFDWRSQHNNDKEIIPYIDLYSIAKKPKKSIELWEEANQRRKIIEILIGKPISDIQQMKFNINGKSISGHTVYRWLLTYQKNNGDIRSLIPKYTQRGCNNLKSSITEELWQYGKDQYLKMERKSMKRAFKVMQAYANDNKQLDSCMSYSTFRRRIKSLNLKEVMKKRIGERNAEKSFELSESQFPHGDYALQSVQIDHTPIDVLVVDNEYRLVTKRPYLTVAFDSHTRCILGYYITYDTPSRLSIAMTLINCISNKSSSLKKVRKIFPNLDPRKIETLESSEWAEVYGLPFTLHMDNGSDFTSEDIKLFGLAYQVHLHYRAVGKAQHGAYVERYLGTLNNRLHSIAGTTYSNVQERKSYPSEKRATYTIEELEARIVSEIALYHEEFHSEIKTTPIAKWKQSFTVQNKERSINRNLSKVNPNKFKFDILPSETRTVQKGGVQIFGLKYSNIKIERWVGVKDPNNAKKNRQFRIRYDPRDIRTIFFYDDKNSEYIELKCINKMIQRYFKDKLLSLWDWKTINTDLMLKGKKEENIKTKLSLISLQVEMDEKTAQRTKSSRQKNACRQRRTSDKNQFISEKELHEKEAEEEFIDPSIFAVKKPQAVKTILIPPKEANPFYGVTKKKAKQQAKNN